MEQAQADGGGSAKGRARDGGRSHKPRGISADRRPPLAVLTLAGTNIGAGHLILGESR